MSSPPTPEKKHDENPTLLLAFLAKPGLNTQLTDKLVEKFVLMALPSDSPATDKTVQQRVVDLASRPQFSVQLMSANFISMNLRLLLPFIAMNNAIKVLNWESVSFNVFLLIVLTNVVLAPLPMLLSLPFFLLVFGVMVPQYLKKYAIDTPSYEELYHIKNFPVPPYHPVSKPVEAKPCSQFLKEFFVNMTDLQNFMVIYIVAWDYLNNTLRKFIYFKFEALSNGVYLGLFFLGLLGFTVFPRALVVCLPAVKVGAIALLWGFLVMMHPNNRDQFLKVLDFNGYIERQMEQIKEEHGEKTSLKNKIKPDRKKLLSNINGLLKKESYMRFINTEFAYKDYYEQLGVPLSKHHRQTLAVEIYELQSFNKAEKEWNSLVYTLDFFVRSSEVRKSFTNAKKLHRKIQKQNEHIKAASLVAAPQPSLSSNYSITSFLSDVTTDSIASFVSGEDDEEQEENDFPMPKEYCESLKDIVAPQNYQFIADDSGWRMDLFPRDWCAFHHVECVVDVDDDSKWVYDAEDGVRVKEFRRRRWVRLVERILAYDEDYEGIDADVFEKHEEHDPEENEVLSKEKEKVKETESELEVTSYKKPHKRNTSLTGKFMTFLNDGDEKRRRPSQGLG